MVVVPISESLIASFHASLDIVARERKFLAMVEAPPLEQVVSFVRGNIERGVAQFVALKQERVVGWVDVVPATTYGISHRGSLGMGVLPEFRGQGIGRLLMKACLDKAWANGLSRIELEVHADNLSAIRLYQAFGFVVEGTKKHGMRMDGACFDTLMMGLVKGGA
jgi:putative acetyltransferase